ncbi:hypothetical protein N8972_01665 [Sulfurospirillum sp.]|nr:hypothetical protein [Sulfurospirillum sp.]
MINDNFDYAELIKQLEDHKKSTRFKRLLETYTSKATCSHENGSGKVSLTLQIEDDKIIDAGLEIEGCYIETTDTRMIDAGFKVEGASMLYAQSSLYLESAFNATLSETFILASNLLKQIKDDTSSESQNSMLFLTAYKECVEAYYEHDTNERESVLSF